MQLKKENTPFTMVANEVLKDKNLSFKAKGLYSYLFSKPDTWDFSSNRMILETKDGRESIMSGLKELEINGYLSRERLPNGKMEYTLKHSLSRENPLGIEKPKSGKPTVAKPHSGKTPLISNIDNTSNTEDKIINKDTATKVAQEFSLKEEIQKLEDNSRRDLNIIAMYLEERKPDIRNKEQLHVAIQRHLRGAKQLCPFSDTQILDALPKAKKATPDFTLETIVKMLTK